ncbi:ABC transporter substrate-binding protein [Paenibacillus cremeus]|uniref:ABC transporter substrate-binding protein n=1 Tax=Paenibacillus cremeus TaxID=2163881 RepID=A0A559K5Y7_9BACL|nr:ABC transporter substrate-binding protein [Paenibacillus cremeus]TVY07513.1 ABC transporter substrate-binding protein [Paenibacillus cremeus]
MKSKMVLSALLSISLMASGCAAGGKEASSGASAGQGGKPEAKKIVKIGITQIVEHPSLDAARQGFIAALKDNGYVEKDNLEIDVQIAQGDATNNLSIAQKFATNKKDLVLAIATPSAQAAAQAIKDTPILFTAITDPLGAKLVQSLEKPGANVTGTSDTHPEAITKLMDFIAKDFPKTKTVGIVANEGEQNSLVNVKKAEESLSKLGIKVAKASVSNGSEVKQAAESLVGRVDAIYIPKDNTVVSSLESVIQTAEKNKIPLFVGEKDSVKRGGFASYGFDYYDLGYTTGKMAVDILKNGKKPADIPVGFPDTLDLALNMKAAKSEGIDVTQSMKDKVKDKKNIIE